MGGRWIPAEIECILNWIIMEIVEIKITEMQLIQCLRKFINLNANVWKKKGLKSNLRIKGKMQETRKKKMNGK